MARNSNQTYLKEMYHLILLFGPARVGLFRKELTWSLPKILDVPLNSFPLHLVLNLIDVDGSFVGKVMKDIMSSERRRPSLFVPKY